MSNVLVTQFKSPLSQAELCTTDGTIALVNLQSQIDGQQRQASLGRLTVAQRAGLTELIAMHGQFLGRIADYERAAELAEQLVCDAPIDGNSWFARAKTQSLFHRFPDALADLDRAEQFAIDRLDVDAARAAVFQAMGQYDKALVIRQNAAETCPDFDTLGALASLRFECGEIVDAERLFTLAQDCYRGISPLPIVWLYFQQGHMWMHEGNLQRAHELFEAAHSRFPAYAAAQGHLAEVYATLGDCELAIALLRPLAQSSDDPDYASQLSRILGEANQTDEAHQWRNVAATRYDELVACYPEAFADHAAQFWLTSGANPQKALQLAQKNLEVRQTPRASSLLRQAAIAYTTVSSLRSRLPNLRERDS